MTESSELMRDWNRIASEKRANNKEKSTQILLDCGVEFESKNGGFHLIIRTSSGTINFWPSTGRFIGGGLDGRGVFNLLKMIGGGPR